MNCQRVLFSSSLTLFLFSFVYSMVYDYYLAGENHRAVMYSLDMALNMAAKGDLIMASSFADKFGLSSQLQHIQSRISLQLALAAILTVLPLFLLSRLAIEQYLENGLCLLMTGGTLSILLGSLLQAAARLEPGFYAVMAGYGAIGLGISGYCCAALWTSQNGQTPRRRRRNSRT